MGNPTLNAVGNTEPAVVKFDGPKDVLITARKLIERPENWAHGYTNTVHGKCVHTAIFSTRYGPDANAAFDAIKCAIGLDADACCPKVWAWNDAPERTHEEILAAFDRAIERCAVGDREGAPTPAA